MEYVTLRKNHITGTISRSYQSVKKVIQKGGFFRQMWYNKKGRFIYKNKQSGG